MERGLILNTAEEMGAYFCIELKSYQHLQGQEHLSNLKNINQTLLQGSEPA